MLPKVSQIFEYLHAVKSLHERIIRSVNEYEKVWWRSDLPNVEGCYINGNGKSENAWLEVHKQEIPPTPALPQVLYEWIVKWNDPTQEPSYIKSRLLNKKEEWFEDDLLRIGIYHRWIEEEWRPWANDALPKTKVQALYMELFSLHQRFQREGDDIELVWGHGLLDWRTSGIHIERPLLITRLELQFDAKRGVFMLFPTSAGTVMETDMLNNIDVPNIQRVQEMGRQLAELVFDISDEKNITPLLLEMVHTISPNGQYKIDRKTPNKAGSPSISYAPVILLRERGGRLWQDELAKILELLKNGITVPDTLKLLTTNDDAVTNAIAKSVSRDPAWKSVGEELLFPLPSNFEQKLIVQKLASSSGVLVQGPPGTGKSHTIVNLVSHLLAHGKRVLVTSEKERALQVLRDKIPQDIRALCVSILGGDTKSVKELEDSIRYIAENMNRLQPDVLRKNIERYKADLHETRQRIQKIQHEINRIAELENEVVSIEGESLLPIEIGKWLSEHHKHDWFPDLLAQNAIMPLSQEELLSLFKLLGSLVTKDIKQLKMTRPDIEILPPPTQFEEKIVQIKQLKSRVKESSIHNRRWELPAKLPDLVAISEQLKIAVKQIEPLEVTWCQTILVDVIKHDNRASDWLRFCEEMSQRLLRLIQLEKELIEFEFVFPEHINKTKAKEDLVELSTKLKDTKEAGWLLKNVLGRKYAYLFEAIRINGLPIRKKGDTQDLLKYLEVEETKSKISLVWNRTMDEFDAPSIDPMTKRFRSILEDLLSLIKSIATWKKVIQPLTLACESLGVPQPYKWTDKNWYEQILLGVEALEDKRQYEETLTFFSDIENHVSSGRNIENAHPSWTNLLNACQHMDSEFWTKNYIELRRLQGLEEDYDTLKKLINKLSQIAPKWTEKLLQQGGMGDEVKIPVDLQQAWKWSKLNHWFVGHREGSRIEEKEAQLAFERKTEARIITTLVADSTWLTQVERITKAQKSSLIAWMNAMKRIGKGTGKYADTYRREASEEMKTCRGAIPVWIMPIQKVIENIQLNGDLFDVVIVDESSQSDLFSLSVLMRAKKVVVVGDDNQISPENVGHDMGEVMRLIDRYLQGIPHKNRFELKTSLYDIASQVFDHRIVLKEHFRCVPEIIQFSNDLMYGGQMDPLRLPLPFEKMEPAVKTVFVDGGYRQEHTSKTLNIPEAEALVDYIVKCCDNTAYDGKTFGVISLQGHDQAKVIEEQLREAIGEEEMLERRLVCGDSYSFQGDERDVIFLSMVAANNLRIGALTKRSDLQRFNVAASRARDQMILFHSVELRDLNPSCARYHLLQYCKEPRRTLNEIEKFEYDFDSQFEKDVFALISARGYRVTPQVKIGTVGKRIDLVIEGIRGRLAVECDGDKWHGLDKWQDDMERQRILERVGWVFWRVRGSAFYRDPVQAMDSLWMKLEELEITPIAN